MTLAELKADKRWFLWNYSPGKRGKATKVPMSATGGKTGTSEDYRSIWVTYNEALLGKIKYMVSGIGTAGPYGIPRYFSHNECCTHIIVLMMRRKN